MNFLQTIGQRLGLPTLRKSGFGFKSALPVGGGTRFGGTRSWFYGLLPGAKVDYRQIAGDPWKNSIVAAAIHWIGRNLPQAPPCVFTEDADGQQKIVPKHALTALLLRPNRYYGGRVLRQATMLSLIVSGNAFWYIVRGYDGAPKELWYLPHFQVRPVPGPNTDDWITAYEYLQNGETLTLPFADVIHFRDGLDPQFPWLGLSPLGSAYRLLVTDNEADGYAASLLRNMGIPGAIISPKEGGEIDQPQADTIKDQYEDSTQGDNRGRPLVLSGPIEVQKLALSPEELLLSTAQDKPEERIAALIGIPVGVLQLGVGLEHSTFNNREQDQQAAWYEGIIPRLDIINSELDVQLLPFLGNPNIETVGADYSKVRALQEALDKLYARLTDAVGGPWMQPNEARNQVGLKEIPEGDVLYPPKAGGMQAEPNEPGGGADPVKPKPKSKSWKSDSWTERVQQEVDVLDLIINQTEGSRSEDAT